jgi:hypothetical protein
VTTAFRRFGSYAIHAATILAGVGLAVVSGWLFASCRAARATCVTFVAAVREGRIADARALASPELEPSLDGSPDTEPARALRRIRAAEDGDLGVVQSGFRNEGFVPFSCFDGGDEATRFWIVAAKDGGTWRVIELRTEMPAFCEGS